MRFLCILVGALLFSVFVTSQAFDNESGAFLGVEKVGVVILMLFGGVISAVRFGALMFIPAFFGYVLFGFIAKKKSKPVERVVL